MFEVARDEWGLPFRQNPLRKMRFHIHQQRRERRLKDEELDKLQSSRLIVPQSVCPARYSACKGGTTVTVAAGAPIVLRSRYLVTLPLLSHTRKV